MTGDRVGRGHLRQHLIGRKVLLWSCEPWIDGYDLGDPELPSGRFVCGATRTPLGDIIVIGVCIPWEWAHVRTGRKDRQRWEDHLRYLVGLDRVLQRHRGECLVVAGDFNQTVPRSRAPQHVNDAVQQTFRSMTIATSGPLPPLQRRAIDHLAHSADLCAGAVASWPEYDTQGAKVSDHLGVEADSRLV